jgi:ATP-dependent DNA helicase HFM1/MER3
LHLNLVEHLNAEIGLGTVSDICAAKKWLAGTFLKVRLEDNPTHYQINGDTQGRDLGARLEQICENAVSELRRLALIEHGLSFKSTEYGDAMARYYMNLATMERILSLPRRPKISEIVCTVTYSLKFFLLTSVVADCHIASPRVQRHPLSFRRETTIQGIERHE